MKFLFLLVGLVLHRRRFRCITNIHWPTFAVQVCKLHGMHTGLNGHRNKEEKSNFASCKRVPYKQSCDKLGASIPGILRLLCPGSRGFTRKIRGESG